MMKSAHVGDDEAVGDAEYARRARARSSALLG